EKHESRARRIAILADLWKDVRLALRQLRRRPAFALAAILVIAIGVGANGAVFAVVDAALFRPLPFPDGDQLAALWDQQQTAEPLPASVPEFKDWQRDNDFLSGIVAIYFDAERMAAPGGWERISVAQVSGDVRAAIGPTPLLGRWFTEEEQRGVAHVALLDESLWRER